jgi:hypothetical protein
MTILLFCCYLTQDLMLAAKKYGLPRLEAICKRALIAGRRSQLDGMLDESGEEEEDEVGICLCVASLNRVDLSLLCCAV